MQSRSLVAKCSTPIPACSIYWHVCEYTFDICSEFFKISPDKMANTSIIIDKKSTQTAFVVEIIITFMTEHNFCSHMIRVMFFLLCAIGEHELPHKTDKIICKYTDLITYSIAIDSNSTVHRQYFQKQK